MSFFARPNLDNTQFKQLKGGEPLTLSGQTQIATITGLTLTDGSGNNIPITASGASNNFDVLTYCNGSISLKTPTASGGTGIYNGASPTTCSVGGLSAGTSVYGSGITTILECIIAPTINPILTSPSVSTVCAVPQTYLYEVGCGFDLCASISFNAGCIDPLYDSGGTQCVGRSCGVSGYTFMFQGSPTSFIPSGALSYTYDSFSATILAGNNNRLTGCVDYCCGAQPYKSDCVTPYCSALSAGFLTSSRDIMGIYPWFWGTFTCAAAAGVGRPNACCIKDIITGGTEGSDYCKVVDYSTGTINTVFNSTSDEYIWFATPNASNTKTCWYIDATNKGTIGGTVSAGGNLFPDPDTSITNMCSCDGRWDGQQYKIYVSNFQTSVTESMELRNS
jgi:hypothetical protein